MVKYFREKIYLGSLSRLKPKYFSFLFYKYHKLFYRSLIFRGRKIWAINFFIKIKEFLKKKLFFDSRVILLLSLCLLTPSVYLVPLKLGSGVERVAFPILNKKKFIFSVKWALKSLKNNSKRLTVKLVSENLIEALQGKGIGLECKKRVYIQAIKNKSLLRFFK